MGEKYVLICEDSIDGIFTGVYDGWKLGNCGTRVELCVEMSGQAELFSQYMVIEADREKAAKVAGTIQKRLGQEVYEQLCYAACSTDEQKGTCIYYALREGLSGGNANPRVLENLRNPYILKVSRIQLAVWHEMHRFLGFVRFRELSNGVLFSVICPDYAVLPLIAPHFADRLPGENWVIYDEKRRDALVHPAGGEWYIRRQVEVEPCQGEKVRGEEQYEGLWKEFCGSITVQERRNQRRQSQNLPIKYRKHLTEFC